MSAEGSAAVDDGVAARGALGVILASATLTVMAGAILGPIVPAIQANLGVSEGLAGLIITTHGALIVLVSPLAGSVIDRVGPKQPYVAGLAVYGVGGGAGLVVDSYLPLLASRAVLGVGVAFVYTGVTVLIYDLYEGRAMQRALGLRSSANSVGAVVWPLVGGALGTIAWQAPFVVYLVAIPLGLLALLVIPTPQRGETASVEIGSGGVRDVVAELRGRRGLLWVYLVFFAANVFLYSIVVFYPDVLGSVGVTSSFTIGLYLAGVGLAGGTTAVLYDRLLTWFDRHDLVAAALVLWLIAFLMATRVSSPATAVPTVVAFGLGMGLVFPSAFAWIEALAPLDRQGQYSSYLASSGYTGQFLAPVVFGPLVPQFGVTGVYAAAAMVVAVGAVGFAAVVLRTDDLPR